MSDEQVEQTNPKAVWRSMRDHHEQIERKVLELLRHPDATIEQVMEVRRVYMSSYERMCKAQEAMLNKFGNYGGVPLFKK